jgi:hypothetical protein
MNVIEALKQAKVSDMWVRPIGWKGTGHALTFIGEQLYFVPTLHGGHLATMPDFEDMIGEWEVVSPNIVNTEVEE